MKATRCLYVLREVRLPAASKAPIWKMLKYSPRRSTMTLWPWLYVSRPAVLRKGWDSRRTARARVSWGMESPIT
ncbi:hypothetical protein [Myxococcus sp. AB025B]|uniref:hypothetical protein n=1 Tax=Myxococcus sp. AB025B TaxID=2562794 RepID=UPI001E38677B|nr:hypothetical protein [Myxococcus sp. AB025B]